MSQILLLRSTSKHESIKTCLFYFTYFKNFVSLANEKAIQKMDIPANGYRVVSIQTPGIIHAEPDASLCQ